MGCGIQAGAKKRGNVTVNIQGPSQFDATLQNPIIESVTAAKPDAILIAPNDVSASRRPIAAAPAAGPLQSPRMDSPPAPRHDSILIAPTDVSASRPPIAAAMAAGIKVVLVDTTLSDPSGAVSPISSEHTAR